MSHHFHSTSGPPLVCRLPPPPSLSLSLSLSLYSKRPQITEQSDREQLLQHQAQQGRREMKRQLELKELSNDQSSSSCYEHESSSVKWMSSKMRIMRKFLCSDQKTVKRIIRRRKCQQIQDEQKKEGKKDQSSCESSNNGGISRVCSDCSTTKTPLWRSGPLGPKSLCNACGIKQMKARKAMSSAALSGKLQYPKVPIKPEKSKSSKVDCSIPFKKRCSFVATAETAQRKLSFEDISVALNESLEALKGVFPQDEKDGAILLMALAHHDS